MPPSLEVCPHCPSPPKKTFCECKWTPGRLRWFYDKNCVLIHSLYNRQNFFRWPAPFETPGSPTASQSGDARTSLVIGRERTPVKTFDSLDVYLRTTNVLQSLTNFKKCTFLYSPQLFRCFDLRYDVPACLFNSFYVGRTSCYVCHFWTRRYICELQKS